MGLFGLLGTVVLGCPLLALWPRLVAWLLRLAAWSLGLLALLLAGGLGAALGLGTRPDVEGPTTSNITHFFVPAFLAVLALGYARLHHEARRHG